ncbi:MAG: hypothetical protein UR23_C0014G0005 [Candidatus Roizmanbacteria bacterium GW2011_GWA2_32_13]|uniref:Uncharacterized protein n=1 Tax=Candidatus Roizmanbacteria bacterium GW2011_GWA2_32_13 TaxID=1618475 RepID=A0A0F9ZD58_9BACT|nr:MAG: hypothetical protein UR23_C0014G0005 [Candidatus Roizmanbacteria bacterium GW2011_GWA2_32_13]
MKAPNFSLADQNSKRDLKEFRELIKHSKESNLLLLFQKTYETCETNLEKEFARSFIKGKNHNNNSPLEYNICNEVYNKEIIFLDKYFIWIVCKVD